MVPATLSISCMSDISVALSMKVFAAGAFTCLSPAEVLIDVGFGAVRVELFRLMWKVLCRSK